jgi:hypothetical protein
MSNDKRRSVYQTTRTYSPNAAAFTKPQGRIVVLNRGSVAACGLVPGSRLTVTDIVDNNSALPTSESGPWHLAFRRQPRCADVCRDRDSSVGLC